MVNGLWRGLIIGGLLLFCGSIAAANLAQQRRWFLAAEKALQRGDRESFRHRLAQLGDYPLAPYLWSRYYRRYPEASAPVEAFLRRYADTRYVRPVRAALLKYLARRERWRDYVWFYQSLGDTELHCHYAWALYRLGRQKQAWQEARALWLVGRSQPKACDRVFAVWRQAGRLTPQLIQQRFRLALAANKPRLARYLAGQIPAALRRRAHFWLQIHQKPEDFICRPWPKVFRRDGEIFSHAVQRLARRDLEAAIGWWQDKSRHFELTAGQKVQALRAIGLRLAWRHDPRAWDWLAAIADDLSDDDVHAWRVRAALRQQQWQRANAALARLPFTLRTAGQWRYWQARVRERLQDTAAARPLFQETARTADFYGFLAADRLGQSYAIRHRPIGPSAAALARLASSRTMRAIQEFLALGRYWEARREWWHLLKSADRDTLLAAAHLARKMGWQQMAIFAVARAEHWDDLEIRFPLRFLAQVRKYASAHHLDPAYVYGIIRRESAFDERARSAAGARGLMQLMPGTARRVARRLNERWRSVRVLENADTNVRYGTAYFHALLERFGGHFVLATAAYNAGPHRVERWLPLKPLPADIWIETIPFRETRRYVRAVLAYAMIYQKRLGQEVRRISDYARPVPGGGKPKLRKPSSQACQTSA